MRFFLPPAAIYHLNLDFLVVIISVLSCVTFLGECSDTRDQGDSECGDPHTSDPLGWPRTFSRIYTAKTLTMLTRNLFIMFMKYFERYHTKPFQ